MGSTNKKLRGKLEDCVRAMRTGREAVSIARRYVPNEWKHTMLNAIEYLTEQISNNKMETFNSGLNKDDDELPKQEYKMAENEKHFEPVTARSLAEKAYEILMTSKVSMTNWKQVVVNGIEKMLEPHIRKPSDDDKSVPERCEEAYNEAMELIKGFAGEFTHEEFMSLRGKADKLIKKPNPFKEADVVHEDYTEPTKIPFSLELAAQGHKVVTRDGRDAKVVAEGLKGVTPICAVITNGDGSKTACLLTLKGELVDHKENPEDLFILKEPETIEIRIFRGENHELHFTASKVIANEDYWTYIKTIKTTI